MSNAAKDNYMKTHHGLWLVMSAYTSAQQGGQWLERVLFFSVCRWAKIHSFKVLASNKVTPFQLILTFDLPLCIGLKSGEQEISPVTKKYFRGSSTVNSDSCAKCKVILQYHLQMPAQLKEISCHWGHYTESGSAFLTSWEKHLFRRIPPLCLQRRFKIPGLYGGHFCRVNSQHPHRNVLWVWHPITFLPIMYQKNAQQGPNNKQHSPPLGRLAPLSQSAAAEDESSKTTKLCRTPG